MNVGWQSNFSVFKTTLFILVVALIWAISVCNGLVNERELVNEGWSSIDIQLKRRFNLIKIQ